MKTRIFSTPSLLLALLAFCTAAYAGTKDDAIAASAAYSSSVSAAGALSDALPEEPQAQSGVPPLPKAEKQEKTASANTEKHARSGSIRPFSTVGIDVKVGIAGAGFDVATPLARKFNLRGGASFFSFQHTFVDDGTSYDTSIKLQTAMLAVDWFPFGGAFRMSPVVQLYNGDSLQANLSVPAGQHFSLGDQDSYSSASDPVHGTASFLLGNQGGNKVAPGFTFGFGNIIPRGRGHWSVPFEAGFVYIQTPQVILNFQGVSCDNQADASTMIPGPSCADIATDPT